MSLISLAGAETPDSLFDIENMTGTVTFESTTVHTGNGAFKFDGSSAQATAIITPFTALSPFWVRFYFRKNTNPSLNFELSTVGNSSDGTITSFI